MNELLDAVKGMRKLQCEYFRTRSQEVLRKSKEAEKRVDQLIKWIEESKTPQAKLW